MIRHWTRPFFTANPIAAARAAPTPPPPAFKAFLQEALNPRRAVDGLSLHTDAPLPLKIRNGIGHFQLPLQRLVFTYCPHNGDSRPLMQYLHEELVLLARTHPTVELVVSCRFGSRASLRAFYNGDFQKARHVYVGGGAKTTARDVQTQVQRLLDASGEPARRFRVGVRSDTPAIRQPHSPFLYRAKAPKQAE